MLSAQPPTLSADCLCLFLVVFHLLKFYLVSLLIMQISIPLATEFTHVYVITHLTNSLAVAYRVFFLVIVPHIKAFVVLTLQPFAHILHGMLDLMRIFSRFQILPVLVLFMLLVFQNFTSPAPLNHLLAHHFLLLSMSLLPFLVIFVKMTLLLSPCKFLFCYRVHVSFSCSLVRACICYGLGSFCNSHGLDSCHYFISSFRLSSHDYSCQIWNFQDTTSRSSQLCVVYSIDSCPACHL